MRDKLLKDRNILSSAEIPILASKDENNWRIKLLKKIIKVKSSSILCSSGE